MSKLREQLTEREKDVARAEVQVEAADQRAEEAGGRIACLKGLLLEKEKELSRLRGYLDRVREEDARRSTPPVEVEAWLRDQQTVTHGANFDFSNESPKPRPGRRTPWRTMRLRGSSGPRRRPWLEI